MNSTSLTRQCVSLLTTLALGGFAAFLLGVIFAAHALALFSGVAIALILLIVAGDYSARPDRLAAVSATPSRRRPEPMALAA